MGSLAEPTHAVFSAHAEVVPLLNRNSQQRGRILRARGGSSNMLDTYHRIVAYSPRTRR